MTPNFSLSPLPDETVYSLATRHHLVSGNASAAETSKQLFGSEKVGFQHDFSCGLDHFFNCYTNHFNDVDDIIENMTLLPYYRSFLDSWLYQRCVDSMKRETIKSLKMEMGLPASRIGADHPLKYCFNCIQEDIQKFGTPYWHRFHQCPGVIICHRHHSPLYKVNDKVNHIKRFEYFLPNTHLNSEKLISDDDLNTTSDQLVKINTIIEGLLNYPTFFLSPEKVVNTYKRQLNQLGFLTPKGNVRQKELIKDISIKYNGFDNLTHFKYLFKNLNGTNIFKTILRKPKASKHPLKHIILINYLFDSFDSFIEKYRSLSDEIETVTNSDNRQQKDELRMYLFEGLSLRKISEIMNISVTTLSIWAREMGHEFKVRPKSITEDIRQKVENALLSSDRIQDIANKFNISRISVNRILNSNATVKNKRKAIIFEKKRDQYRSELFKIIKNNIEITRKQIADNHKSTFSWLFRNDKTWLYQNLPDITKNSNQSSSVNWSERDQFFHHQILLKYPNNTQKLKKSELIRSIDGLRKYENQIHKMPMTLEIISTLTNL